MGASQWLVRIVALLAAGIPAGVGYAQTEVPPGSDGPNQRTTEIHDADVELIEGPRARGSAGGLEEQSAEPRYVLERVVVRGNRKTRQALILQQLGLTAGDVVTPADKRVVAARLRLMALGFFLDVRLSLAKGESRGSAILVVEVEERGTVIINGVFLGISEATALWGGLDLAENNFLGRGILLAGAFVQSTRPTVPGSEPGQAYRLQFGAPVPSQTGLWFSGSFLANHGSEFFRAFGDREEVDPQHHVATTTRRLGGRLGLRVSLSRSTRLTSEIRLEGINATLPDIRSRDLGGGRSERINFSISEGRSRLASVIFGIEVDKRDDHFLPRSGNRFAFSFESGLSALASNYSFTKGVVQYAHHVPFRSAKHSFSVHLLAGVIHGYAPYFDRFFVADLNILLPSRALGLNFSSLPSRNFLNTSVNEHRFDDYAGRVMAEYAVSLWRGRGFLYRADGFAGLGVFGIAGHDDLRFRKDGIYRTIPIDLTADLGVRLDTLIGIFNISIANALGRLPY